MGLDEIDFGKKKKPLSKMQIFLISLGVVVVIATSIALGIHFGIDKDKTPIFLKPDWENLTSKKYRITLKYENSEKEDCYTAPWDTFRQAETYRFLYMSTNLLFFDKNNRDAIQDAKYNTWRIENVNNNTAFALYVEGDSGTKHYLIVNGNQVAASTSTNNIYDITDKFEMKNNEILSTNTPDSLQCKKEGSLWKLYINDEDIEKSPNEKKCKPLTVVLSEVE